MKTKFLVVGAIVAGITLFVWGFVTHAALPLSERALTEFKDAQAVVQVIRANAPQNGVYFAKQGIFAAVSFLPDVSDKTQNITPNLIREFVIDVLAGLFLGLVLLGTRGSTVMGRVGLLVAAALAAVASQSLPAWNWYGFSLEYTTMEVIDLVGGWFLAGLVLAGLMKKMVPAQ